MSANIDLYKAHVCTGARLWVGKPQSLPLWCELPSRALSLQPFTSHWSTLCSLPYSSSRMSLASTLRKTCWPVSLLSLLAFSNLSHDGHTARFQNVCSEALPKSQANVHDSQDLKPPRVSLPSFLTYSCTTPGKTSSCFLSSP